MDDPARTAQYLLYRQNELSRIKSELSALAPGEYILELGCGHGHFLTGLAGKFTVDGKKFNYAGVDKNPDRIERANRKSGLTQLPITWFNASIEDVLELWPKPCTISQIFVLFPDPWPKAKHHKNRFVNPTLLQTLAKISKKGALFHFRTDHDGYFDAANEMIAAQSAWKPDTSQSWPADLPATVFEGHHPRYQSLIATLGG